MSHPLLKLLAIHSLAPLLIACGSNLPQQSCTHATTTRLYLGQDTPFGVVTDAQWQRFVEDTLTPQFPDGFTVLNAKGQWRNTNRKVQQEDTRVVEIVHEDSPLLQARVRAIAHAYKRVFSQQSVLVAQSPSYQCS
jgi:Protein of unknown function (DUF3574)